MEAHNNRVIACLISSLLLLTLYITPAFAQEGGDDRLTLADVPELDEGFNCKAGRRKYFKFVEYKIPRLVKHQEKVVASLEKGITRLNLRGAPFLECEGLPDEPVYCRKAAKVLSRLDRHKEVKTRKAGTKLERLYVRESQLVQEMIDLAEHINTGGFCAGDGRRA